jgi:hypothetical protein
MKKLAHNLASIGKELYLNGFEKEAQTMLFTSLRIAHTDHPLFEVMEEMGFEDSGDGESTGGLEIFINVHPDGKTEYELVKGGDSHDFDSFEELVSHLVEDDSSDCGCGCGGGCKEASSSIFRKADSLVDSLKEDKLSREYMDYVRDFGYMPYEDWLAEVYYGTEFNKTSATKKKNKPLNKPFRTPGGPKKFSVYVKNESGNVVKVNFGDPNMSIRRDEPGRRKNFRARHNCDTAKDPTKPRTWSCRMWQKGKSVSDMTNRKKK